MKGLWGHGLEDREEVGAEGSAQGAKGDGIQLML